MINSNDIKQPEELDILNIFTDSNYVIPIYQRNYAWTVDEIEQLLEDIDDASGKYYLGSLIVNQVNSNVYEVIDGQQRLTTLFLLLSYLDELSNNNALKFEAREKSNKTLQNILTAKGDEEWYSESIVSGYASIERYFERINDKNFKEDFIKKLHNIKIIRTQVPKNIDLNHYFEIMNTRGEQLELHEIVKARIIGALEDSKEKEVSAIVWDACSNMDKYVQMSFEKEVRKKLFGNDWNKFQCNSFNDVVSKFSDKKTNSKNDNANQDDTADSEKSNEINNEKGGQVFSLLSKLEKPIKENIINEKNSNEENERFESIISFPNFLLQVNRVINIVEQHNKKINNKLEEEQKDKNVLLDDEINDEDKTLDDKRFIKMLLPYWSTKDAAQSFIYNLLKYRFLFDNYIIKREYANDYKNDGKWSLQKLKKYTYNKDESALYVVSYDEDENTQLKILQSCLRVTYTSPKTMQWISLCLANIEYNNKAEKIIEVLEKHACRKIEISNFEKSTGFNIARIVFTYLDYLLWKEYKDNKNKGKDYIGKEDKYKNFQFQFRSSIEHFYPQHPIKDKEWEDKYLNSFGNLALITVSANSKFSNLPPESKVNIYKEVVNQSLKLVEMKAILDKNGEWKKGMVKQHCDEMNKLIQGELDKYNI